MDDVYEEPGPYPAIPAYQEETMPFRIPADYDGGEMMDGDPEPETLAYYIAWLERELAMARAYRNTMMGAKPAEPKEAGDE